MNGLITNSRVLYMITRGHIIGNAVDSVSEVVEKVKMRNKLNLTDINIHVENYFKRIIETVYQSSFKNVNRSASNTKGIDLILEGGSLGWQITSQRSSRKIRRTIEKSLDNDNVDELKILIVGDRQDSYASDVQQEERLDFDVTEDLLDTNDLMKKLIDVDIESLKELNDYLERETFKVKIELEVPDESGSFPTSVEDYIEPEPETQIDTVESFCDYLTETNPIDTDECLETRRESLASFSDKLSKIPRITREFYCFLLERIDENKDPSRRLYFNYNRLKRICNFPNMEEELDLLDEYGLVRKPGPKRRDEPQEVIIMEQGQYDYLIIDMRNFMRANGINFRDPIVHLDFSGFA